MIVEALEIAAALCKRFEGFYSKPYICPAGVWTIGYGSIWDDEGKPVTKDHPPVTEAKAVEMLMRELRQFLPQVLQACPVLSSEPPQRLAAVVSWTYNLGAGRLRSSTMRRRINERNWPQAAEEMKRWNRGGGRVLRGLVIRREAEAKLLLN